MKKQLLGLTVFLILNTAFLNVFGQKGIFRTATVYQKNNSFRNTKLEFKDNFTVLESGRGVLDLTKVEKFVIENRTYKVLDLEGKLGYFEELVAGKVSLFQSFDYINYYSFYEGKLSKIPEKYFKQYITELAKLSCDCPEIANNLSSYRFTHSVILNTFKELNERMGGNPVVQNIKRTFNESKPVIGFGLKLLNTKANYKNEEWKVSLPENTTVTPYFQFQPASFGKFTYSAEIFSQRINSKNMRPNQLYIFNGEKSIDALDTMFFKAISYTNVFISNKLHYKFKSQEFQKLIPSVYVGPSLAFYAKNAKLDLFSTYRDFRGYTKQEYELTNGEFRWSPLKVGFNGGVNLDYFVTDKWLMKVDLGVNWMYGTFATRDDIIFTNKDVPMQFNETNLQYWISLGVSYKF
jgi:hypothetical protein